MEIQQNLLDAINNSHNVAIFIHVRPDGDCIGSGMACKLALESMGKKADVYCDGIIGKEYSYIKDIDLINHPKCTEYDTSLSVDVSTFSRMGCYAELYKKAKCRICIDHHYSNESFGDINLIDGSRASTCEMIYEILLVLGVKINNNIADALYTGIATDTGCFKHDSVQPITHIIAADLMHKGANIGVVNTAMFKNKTLGQVELQKRALNSMQLFYNNRVCVAYLTKGDFLAAHCNSNETQGLVDVFVGIEGVEIGVLISEDKPNICAVSFRGKGNLDVSKLADYFGGGGHKNAAGCNIFGNAKPGVKKIVKAIEEVYAGIY